MSTWQDVADGGGVRDSEMMNVAVVSDIGWKSATGAEPTTEDVWAQYDFKCAVSDVLEYAEYLGMDIKEDAHLLWIADEALQAPEPQGWEQRLDPKGGVYYYHPTTGMSLNQHPLDYHYQQFYLQMKAQYDMMYANEKSADAAEGSAAPERTSDRAQSQSYAEDSSKPSKERKGFLSKILTPRGSKGGVEEVMYELSVDLQRQQDRIPRDESPR